MSEDKELKVMESRVREAMNSCPDAQEVFETLFGEQLGPPSPPKFQKGDIVCGKGEHSGATIDNHYGIVTDDTSPFDVLFFKWRKGWGENSDHWEVPEEKLELVYRPEK